MVQSAVGRILKLIRIGAKPEEIVSPLDDVSLRGHHMLGMGHDFRPEIISANATSLGAIYRARVVRDSNPEPRRAILGANKSDYVSSQKNAFIVDRRNRKNEQFPMFSLFRPVIRWAATRALVGRIRDRNKAERARFTRNEVNRFADLAWDKYQDFAPNLPSQPTRGSQMNVRLAALTLSMFQVLLEAGIERTYAIELVSDMTWNVYRQWVRLSRFALRILPESLTHPVRNDANVRRHVKKDGTFVLGFPFNAPGYIAWYVPMKGAAAFDMIRCPVAEVFRGQGSVDLCLSAWCNLDYSVAEMTGLKLQRTTTIVEGSDRCDFRWYFS